MGRDEDRTCKLLQVWRHTVGSSFSAAVEAKLITEQNYNFTRITKINKDRAKQERFFLIKKHNPIHTIQT